MADNVPISAGSGTNIATDDCAGVHYQEVKLADGTLNSTTIIAAGGGVEANALRVTIATDSTGKLSVIGGVSNNAPVTNGPLLGGGLASVAAPSAVDTDGDAVWSWHTMVGAQVIQVSAAGALIGGDATNGLDVDVTRLPALPTGTNIIGGIGAGATSIGKVEDTAAVAADVGVPAMARRYNSIAATSSTTDTDGDYEMLQIDNGQLLVKMRSTVSCSIIDGTVMAQGNAVGMFRTSGFDKHDAAPDAVGGPTYVGGIASAAAPTPVDADGDVVRGWYLRNGAQASVITAAGALIGGDAANGLDVDVTRVPTDPFGANADAASATGSISAKLRQIAAIGIPITGIPTVGGDLAHDAVDSGNPIKLGQRAIAHGTNPTAVAAADRTDWLASRAGVPFVMGGHPNIVTLEYATTGAQTNTAIVAASGTLKYVVTQIQILADNANIAFPSVRVGFHASTTPTTTGVLISHPGVPAGGGVSRGDGSGILGVSAASDAILITCGAPTTGSLRVLISYYSIES